VLGAAELAQFTKEDALFPLARRNGARLGHVNVSPRLHSRPQRRVRTDYANQLGLQATNLHGDLVALVAGARPARQSTTLAKKSRVHR